MTSIKSTTHDLTEASFSDAIAENDIVFVDFWAAWCGPCRSFAPTYTKAAEKHSDIYFGKVDTEAEQGLAAAAGIQSIPTLMAFREQILVFSQPGALGPAALDEVIAAVRAIDMEDVHRKVTEQREEAELPSS